jgi:hypothetical protein
LVFFAGWRCTGSEYLFVGVVRFGWEVHPALWLQSVATVVAA